MIAAAGLKNARLTQRDDGPGSIHANIVDPVVENLGSAVGHALSPVGHVVEGHAVDVCRADDDLEEVTAGMVADGGGEGEEREGAPGELPGGVSYVKTEKGWHVQR